jgi:hypothetical protein
MNPSRDRVFLCSYYYINPVTLWDGNSLASSNDTKRIPTNNLVSTSQPMTATLIFRRQLVRHKPDLLTVSSTADKLPLEKFHRLLDLVFWIKFLKFDSISCFVFLWDVYRVSLNPVVFDLAGLRRNPDAAGGTCHA